MNESLFYYLCFYYREIFLSVFDYKKKTPSFLAQQKVHPHLFSFLRGHDLETGLYFL